MNSRQEFTILLFLTWSMLTPGFCSDVLAILETMGNKYKCTQYPREIHWVSEKTSAIVIGKSEDLISTCQLKFGLATDKESARMRLNFDFMYNHACGVYLQINESTSSDFLSSKNNQEMFLSHCNTRNPGPLFAQPKNFVLVSLIKSDERMEAYNFRLNISMAEHLPARGPDLHVVIIVGFILLTLVTMASVLLFKYITRISFDWLEYGVEETRARAINIYNSQEHSENVEASGGRQLAKGCTDGSEIAAINSNCPVERFNSLFDVITSVKVPLTDKKLTVKKSEAIINSSNSCRFLIDNDNPSTSAVSIPCQVADPGDTISIGCNDIPPSYEEALEMPVFMHLENGMSEDGEHIALGGRLEIDCFNLETREYRESGIEGADNNLDHVGTRIKGKRINFKKAAECVKSN